jgi:hypothetical protein
VIPRAGPFYPQLQPIVLQFRDKNGRLPRYKPRYSQAVPDEFDPGAMIERFRARAAAVRNRGIPPIEGPERKRFVEQAQLDFMDYAMLGDAEATLEDGVLTLRVDLKPKNAEQA